MSWRLIMAFAVPQGILFFGSLKHKYFPYGRGYEGKPKNQHVDRMQAIPLRVSNREVNRKTKLMPTQYAIGCEGETDGEKGEANQQTNVHFSGANVTVGVDQ